MFFPLHANKRGKQHVSGRSVAGDDYDLQTAMSMSTVDLATFCTRDTPIRRALFPTMARYTSMSLLLVAAVASRRCAAFAPAGPAAAVRASTVVFGSKAAEKKASRSTWAEGRGHSDSASTASMSGGDDNDFDDFSSKTCFMFPGQGAQFVGMCGELCEEVPAAKALFDQASEILGYDLLEKCTNGPKEVLDSTEVSQPAIFVASMAAVEKLRQEEGEDAVNAATCAMGLSLGEYSALCYAGALDFADGVRVTKARGEAMQAASDAVNSGMVSVIGLGSDVVAELCEAASEKAGKPIQIANYLCNGNYAVSGASEACDVVAEIAKPEFKARMTVKLAVAGAFHTDFMAPAVPALEKVLEDIEFKKPRIPVISNVDAAPHSDPATIKKLLATQVTSPVLWEKTMDSVLAKDFERAVELGPGKVTAGILKRFSKQAECTNVEV